MRVILFFARFKRSGHTIQQCEKNRWPIRIDVALAEEHPVADAGTL
jgi:hypothetical protein